MMSKPRVRLPEYVDLVLSPLVTTEKTAVVTGFWRSGTTWFQQLLAHSLKGKRIFEPFYPGIERYAELRPEYASDLRGYTPLDAAWMPFRENGIASPLQEYLVDCLSGRISRMHESGLDGFWLRSSRDTQWEALRLRVVVKFVRGQLMLPGLVSTFDVPVLHLRRDPRAVLASFKRKGWVDWFRCEAPLQNLLLHGNDGRAEYFGRWKEGINQVDQNGSAFGQAAAYWVLTERYVDEMASEEQNIRIVEYQRLREERNEYLLGSLSGVGIESGEPVPEKIFEKRSMTAQVSTEDSIQRRRSDWTDTLDESEVCEIDRALERFDFPKAVYTE